MVRYQLFVLSPAEGEKMLVGCAGMTRILIPADVEGSHWKAPPPIEPSAPDSVDPKNLCATSGSICSQQVAVILLILII